MKIPKEYVLLFIVGLFVLAYILDSVVKPLTITLASPYHYFVPAVMNRYPFSTTSIVVRTLAIFATPLWLFSFSSDKGFGKPTILFILAVLIQLYAIQDIVNKSRLVPLEWSIPLAISGLLLLIPTVFLFIKSFLVSAHRNLTNAKMEETIKRLQEEKQENVIG